MAALTEWLQLMLAEIARKRDERERDRQEELRRSPEDAESHPIVPAAGITGTNGGKPE